jgi:hypothetical protein
VNDPFQKLLDSFELLLEVEKQQIVIEILHRTLNLEIPPLMEDELILSAEAIFLSLDTEETE